LAPPESPDRLIADLARRQHGVVARRQLLDLGLGPRAIGSRLERGSLHLVHRGVYAVGHSVLGRTGRWMAAVLACGPGAVLSHRAAAACWGLLAASGWPEVSRPGQFRQRPRIMAHFSSVPRDERTLLEGIPVTTVPRTILDLAALQDRRNVERALHEAEVRRLQDRLSVFDLMRRYPGRPGSRLLEEVLADPLAKGVPVNDFEDAMADLISRHGLPTPRYNPDLVVGGRCFRPDCLWSAQMLIVELDGAAVHRTQKAFEHDRERDRILLAAGYRTIRVTWTQLHDEPDAIASDIRNALVSAKLASSPK